MSVDATYTASTPAVPPVAPSSVASRITLEFCSAMLRVSPPWLRRRVGGAIMKSLGVPVDDQANRTVEGVELRFPSATHPDALGYTGRERRILRGPGESDSGFSARLRFWWDSHQIRGSAYALAAQLHAFFLESNNVPIQIIANSGTRVSVDTAGTITRDDGPAGWSGDGEYPLKWARFFVVFFLDGTTIAVPLLAEDGEPLTTEDGEALLATVSIYALDADTIETLCAVPREWSAAHIDRIYITLVPINGIAWGIPDTLEWGEVGRTWGGDLSVNLTC